MLGLEVFKQPVDVYLGAWFNGEGASAWLLVGVDDLRGVFDVSMPVAKSDTDPVLGSPGRAVPGHRRAAAGSHTWCS